jgi:hypothetical protein
MTEYIRTIRLLPADEVDMLVALTPTEILTAKDIGSWADWIATLTHMAGDPF